MLDPYARQAAHIAEINEQSWPRVQNKIITNYWECRENRLRKRFAVRFESWPASITLI